MYILSNWKLHLPVDVKGTKVGYARQVTELKGFNYPPYFIQNPDGTIVCETPADGARTSKNTKYARTEFREMTGGKEAAWMLTLGSRHVMNVTMSVDAAPTQKDGTPGRQVIGQIHGKKEELCRLYREGDGTILFANDRSLADNKEHKFLLKDANNNVAKHKLGQKISYTIEATPVDITVSATIEGVLYSATTPVNTIWNKDKFYFKVGLYLGVNKSQGATGSGRVTLHDFGVSHK